MTLLRTGSLARCPTSSIFDHTRAHFGPYVLGGVNDAENGRRTRARGMVAGIVSYDWGDNDKYRSSNFAGLHAGGLGCVAAAVRAGGGRWWLAMEDGRAYR